MRWSDPLDADFVLLITNEAPFIDPLIAALAVYKKGIYLSHLTISKEDEGNCLIWANKEILPWNCRESHLILRHLILDADRWSLLMPIMRTLPVNFYHFHCCRVVLEVFINRMSHNFVTIT